MSYTALIDDLRYGGMERGGEIADILESQAREITELRSMVGVLSRDYLAEREEGQKMVIQIEELRAALVDAVSALDIASKFCGSHTAEECSDSVAIPINEALTLCKEVL